jgi:hypothetical protein
MVTLLAGTSHWTGTIGKALNADVAAQRTRELQA